MGETGDRCSCVHHPSIAQIDAQTGTFVPVFMRRGWDRPFGGVQLERSQAIQPMFRRRSSSLINQSDRLGLRLMVADA